jgi:threonine 3-dehydrogenase
MNKIKNFFDTRNTPDPTNLQSGSAVSPFSTAFLFGSRPMIPSSRHRILLVVCADAPQQHCVSIRAFSLGRRLYSCTVSSLDEVCLRALVKTHAGPGMELCDVPIPEIGPGDVLIRVSAAGVCGTDLHIWEWDAWAAGRLQPPTVIGHEFAGTIAKLGDVVAAAGVFAIGDEVTAEGHIVCGDCLPCRTGDAHLCIRTKIIGVDRDGCFADYIAMPASNVMRLDGIPLETGAIMDPLGNAVHTALEGGDIAGAAVLVLGCGPIGCWAAGVAKAAGAAVVIASDYNARRRELATTMGADLVLDPAVDDVVSIVRERTKGLGADLVCEMSGHPNGHATAFAAARPGGRLNLLGTPSRTTEVDFARDVIFKGLTLYGVTGRRMYRTWHQMRRLVRSGQLDPRPVITHRFPLEQMAEAIAVIKNGEAGKVILEIGS